MPPIFSTMAIAGEPMPSGLSTAAAPSNGPTLKAEPTNDIAMAATASHIITRQRGVSGRPVGKSWGRSVAAGTMQKSQAQVPGHMAYA